MIQTRARAAAAPKARPGTIHGHGDERCSAARWWALPDRAHGKKHQDYSAPEAQDVGQAADGLDIVAETVVGTDHLVDAAQRTLIGRKDEGEKTKRADDYERRQEKEVGQQRFAQLAALRPSDTSRVGFVQRRQVSR